MKLRFLLFFVLLLWGCAPLKKITVDPPLKPLSDNAEVAVVDIKQPVPEGCSPAGTLEYRRTITAGNSYNNLVEDAKKQARKMGGNIVKVTDLQVIGNSIVLKISVYYRANINNMDAQIQATKDSVQKAKFGVGAPTYAILYIYCPYGQGQVSGYNVEMDGKVIWRAKPGLYAEIKLYREGPATIVAETTGTGSATMDVEFGKEYYLQCTLQAATTALGRPYLQLMPAWKGMAEYEDLKQKHPSQGN